MTDDKGSRAEASVSFHERLERLVTHWDARTVHGPNLLPTPSSLPQETAGWNRVVGGCQLPWQPCTGTTSICNASGSRGGSPELMRTPPSPLRKVGSIFSHKWWRCSGQHLSHSQTCWFSQGLSYLVPSSRLQTWFPQGLSYLLHHPDSRPCGSPEARTGCSPTQFQSTLAPFNGKPGSRFWGGPR